MQSTFDALALHWAHTDVLDLPVLEQLAVMAVLVLDDLVNISGRRGRTEL